MGSRLEANSSAVRKRIEKHKFEDEGGEEYESSKFGGFNDYFRRKKIKLQNLDANLRSSSAKNHPIFRGVVAHVNGYTQPSLNDIHKLIVSHGGGFMQYLDGKTTVTHIIASNLTPKKKIEFQKYRVVKPAWVVDSIGAGKLLPWDAYRVVDEGIGQRVLGFENGNVISQVNNLDRGYKDQTETSWYTGQVKGVADKVDSHGPERLYPSRQLSWDARDTDEARRNSEYISADPADHILGDDVTSFNSPEGVEDEELDPNVFPAADQSFIESQGNDDHELASEGLAKNGSGAPRQSFLHEPVTLEGPSANIVNDMSPGAVSPRTEAEMFAVENFSPEDFASHEDKGVEIMSPERRSVSQELDLKETQHTAEHATEEYADPDDPDSENFPFQKRSSDKNTTATKSSAEEHNAQLLADPRVWKSTVVNPGFLKQYYEESRLHHLSAWKAELKSQMQKMAAEKTSSQRLREKRVPGARRYILHVDFDSFFAAVSLKKFPQYVDRPVVIAHGGGSGSEIASCNYPARKFGVKNGMWMKHAQKMCPDLKVLPYDFPAYEDASRYFYTAVMDTGGVVQSVSVDEALIDVSAQCTAAGGHEGKGIYEGSIWREQAKADEISINLRDEIKEKTGCAVSVGIGGNILLAKVALRKAKPAGQYQIKPEEVLEFLGGLTVQELPGVAYSIGSKLEEIGVKFVKDVRELSKEKMITTLGPKTGEKIWDYARGIDRTEVGEQVIRKSVSAEVNWGIRFVTQEQADEFVNSLCEELHKRLLNEGLKGRQLTMKFMRRAADAPLDPPKHLGHGKCDTFNKSLILGVSTNDKDIIGREAISIMRGFGFSPGELRGIGVQMQRLEPLKGDNPQDISQRRLQFKTSNTPKRSLPKDDNVVDDIESPQKPKVSPPPHRAATFAKETSPTPNGKPRMPLNTLGTQFVLPTQVDPEVLAELPSDIRSKLLGKQPAPDPDQSRDATPIVRSRSGTPNLPPDALPSHSQLDPEILNALPDDVRAEILAFYHHSPHKALAKAAQAVLPQSPRKNRTTKLPKKLTTPIKKRTGLFSRGGNKASSAFSTLTQSNFVANARPGPSSSKVAGDEAPADIPDDFLSALPDDIRREVLAQARRDRLQKKGGIDFASNKKKRPPSIKGHQPTGQRTLTLPPRPPKPTFTAQKFTRLPELREAISSWFEEFRDEGPYAEDVDALVRYLGKVVGEEGDMEKAVSVGRWVGWVVDEGVGDGSGKVEGDRVWKEALGRVQEGVQRAVEQRGLGRVDF
ncbi:MAG: deoxycytidyl transferase [Alectoria fallacina]|uniref:DNA repair protein REV1 n=1 Tax=Alectoria fallacina TaxID=1903189 RepID=A0A8H3EAA7_9LECA|nr:MAG: deoxycytidyl transferase [Alectoria fallacina]